MLDPGQDAALKERIANGFVVESMDDMTPGYHKALKTQMLVQGDTELMSAPAYYLAAKDAPTISSRIAVSAVIQDELGHANIAYRLLEDLGENKEYARRWRRMKLRTSFDRVAIVLTAVIFVAVVVFYVVGRFGFLVRALF